MTIATVKPQPPKTRRAVMGWPLAVGLCVVLAGDARAQGSMEADRAALEALYRAAGGDGWIDNTNWLSSAPLSDWYGVEVNRNGRVTRLHLGGWDDTVQDFIDHGLTGSLPPELGRLSHIRRLQIGGNSGLMGPIPPELSSLTHLEDLNLQANRLTGSIPAGLGRLANLKGLSLTRNQVSGQVPTELGNLTGLTRLDLRGTMLSGPLPESLTRLSALTWLQLEGSGLCVPDLPSVQAWLDSIRDFTGAVCIGSPTFLRVVTQPGLGLLDAVHAVADLNGDGRDDVIAGERQETNVAAPEERFTKTTLRILVGEEDGGFTYAPELVDGTIDARIPIVVADDFNGDGQVDLAVFDYGGYVFAERRGYGNPPQLFLSSADGRLRPSDALADAVRREHTLRPQPHYSGPADLHLKSATSGDIDGDGDIDLWVDSIGGQNVYSHFMINNGEGTFTVDETRAPPALRYNWPENWYHLQGHLVDLDSDGDLDLALGQSRKITSNTMNQFSIALINDGAGYYPTRIELPHPAFNEGYTQVTGQAHFDVNGDGFQDLLLAHLRNDESLPNLSATGRYIQVLVNRGGMSFGDETTAWMGDQSATTPERNLDGHPLYNSGALGTYDIDRDGCADLVMLRGPHVRTESPLVYQNDGSGGFQAMPPVPFAGSTPYFGNRAVPADVNGDEVIDFVVPHRENGPDLRVGTADDFTMLVTLLNTTPAGPLRCGQGMTAVGALPALGGGADSPRGGGGWHPWSQVDDSAGITVVSIDRNGAADPIGRGERVRLSLTLNDHITVTGSPRLAVTVGAETRLALFSGKVSRSTSGGSSTSRLDFYYDVQRADVDTDGVWFAVNALRLNGGTIRDASGTDVPVDLGAFALTASAFTVDGGLDNPPVVTSVSVRQPGYPWRRDTFELGERIVIDVVFSEYVDLTGTPSLGLTLGTRTRPAVYASRHDSISGTTRLRFAYDVEASDLDSDGLSIVADALSLNGGTIRDTGGTDADLNLGQHAVTNDPDRKVDGRVDNPPVLALGSYPDDTFGRGGRIRFSIRANEHLSVTGEPTLALLIGSQTRQMQMYELVHGDYGSVLRFHYDVQVSDLGANGLAISSGPLFLNGGTIRDAGGNDATLNFQDVDFHEPGRYKVDGGIDTALVVKSVGLVSRPRIGDTYRLDEVVEATVRFDKAPYVIGAPALTLDVGGKTRRMTYDGISASGISLVFRYTVQASDRDADGIEIGPHALTLEGGAIRDSEGRDSDLSLENVDHSTWGLHKVDGGARAGEATPE